MTIKSTLQLIPGVPKTPETVDQILSTFTTTVQKLKATQAHQFAQRDTLTAQAEALKAQAEAADVEAGRATAAIRKIESFLA